MKTNLIKDKSFDFAVRVVKLYQFLNSEKKEYVLSKQVLRSGTSIGANVRESEHAQSRPDFLSKMNIALKEANETLYWLELLYKTNYIDEKSYKGLFTDCEELTKLLASIVKTIKNINNDN